MDKTKILDSFLTTAVCGFHLGVVPIIIQNAVTLTKKMK